MPPEVPPPEPRRSACYDGAVGITRQASAVPARDYLIDAQRFASEGNWAFCRFDSDDIPALRLGFQRGGFNMGTEAVNPSREYLQLHLELMTREGAVLWLPSGVYPASQVVTSLEVLDIALADRATSIFRMRHWPAIECHFQSVDRELEADLEFRLDTITVLPDCRLPHCAFAMWESIGEVKETLSGTKLLRPTVWVTDRTPLQMLKLP